ncbi:hypothetical protein [Vibrio rumoiensis]|uniref:hypothetical protein n=1 Tax=Vibrio rumoiensis TaxID=76258 RepID=UPI003AA89B4C
MRQRVLYFNVVSLLLSAPCRENLQSIQLAFDATHQFGKESIENISLDKQAIHLLNEFSRKMNVLLYPLQQRFTRDFLVIQGFDDSALAPNASYKVRYGDSNEVNHKIAHASTISADWFIASDKYDKVFLEPHYSDRFIDTGVEGVCPSFIQRLIDKFVVIEK